MVVKTIECLVISERISMFFVNLGHPNNYYFEGTSKKSHFHKLKLFKSDFTFHFILLVEQQ